MITKNFQRRLTLLTFDQENPNPKKNYGLKSKLHDVKASYAFTPNGPKRIPRDKVYSSLDDSFYSFEDLVTLSMNSSMELSKIEPIRVYLEESSDSNSYFENKLGELEEKLSHYQGLTLEAWEKTQNSP